MLAIMLACLASTKAQVQSGVFDSTAIAIDMDSTDTDMPVADTAAYSYPSALETQSYTTSGYSTIDTIMAKRLFRTIDKYLPNVEARLLADSIYCLYRLDDNEYGEIKKITGDARTVNFKLNSAQNEVYGIKHSHTFNQVYEFVLTDNVDVIVLVSEDKHAFYMAYCSPDRLCNHLAYLMELNGTSANIYELESDAGADVAMFNYTLNQVNLEAGADTYPLGDLEKRPKVKKNKGLSEVGTILLSISGPTLIGILLSLLLML